MAIESNQHTLKKVLSGGSGLSQLILSFDWSKTSLGSIYDWPQSLVTSVSITLQSPVPMLLLWGEYGVMIYNDAYSAYCGERHPHLLGSNFSDENPRLGQFDQELFRQVLEGHSLSFNKQKLGLSSNAANTEMSADIKFNPVIGEEGKPAGVMVTLFAVHSDNVKPGGFLEVNALKPTGEVSNRLYSVFMQAPAFIAVLRGPRHVLDLVNPRYMQLIGKDRNVIGKPVMEAVPEVRGQGFIELLDNVYKTGEPYIGKEVPAELIRKPGGKLEKVYLDFVYQPLKDAQGEVRGIFVHGIDVTEQVLSRRRIAESEAKYRTLFETMDQGFCIFEMIFDRDNNPLDYRWIEVNPVFEKLTGLKDPVGKTAREMVPNLEAQWFEIYGKVALTGEDVHFVQGSEAMGRWFDVYAFKVGGDDSNKVALLFTDITARKQTELALKFSENQLRLITDSLPAFISYINNKQQYQFVNSAYEKWLGLSKAQIVGKPIQEILGNEIYKKAQPCIEKVMEGERVTYENTIEIAGENRTLQLGYVPNFSNGNKVDGFVVLGHDITEMKKAEEALRRSEEYYKTMTDNTPVMTWVSDPNGQFIFLNRQWYDYTGQTPETGLGNGWLDALHPADAEELRKSLTNANREQMRFSFEYRLKGKTGNFRWHLATGLPKFDEQGRYEGFVGSVIEIHERKLAEEALKAQSELTQIITDNATTSLFIKDEKQHCTFMNPAAEKMTGYTLEEVKKINKPLHDIIHHTRPDGSHFPEEECLIDHALPKKDRTEGESVFVRPDGSFYPVSFTASPIIRNGKTIGTVMEVRDTTEEKEAADKLKESEEFNRTLLESSPDCVKALDLNGKLLSINPQGQKMLKLDGLNVYKGMVWADLWEGNYYKEATEALKKARNGELGHFQGMTPTAKGIFKWWDVLVAPIYGASGNVERLIAVSRDITTIKELEQQKDDFIGIASHELKTPVTSIKAYTQILQRRFEGNEDELSSEMLARMDGQVDRLTNLIVDLLDITKIEQGKLQFSYKKFNFNELIKEEADEIQRTTNKHRVILDLDEDKMIHGDRDRIGQVLINLFNNAIKYSPKADKIMVKTHIKEGKELILSVQDFGMGLTNEELGKVFDRFYRVEEVGNETYPGLGLGLYISAEIIHRHNGKIWAESEKGKGSTFYFSLPYKD